MLWYRLQASEIVYLPQLLFIVTFSIFAFWSGAIKIRWFWPALIIAAMVAPGWMINRLSWIDELLIAALVLGVLMRLMVTDSVFEKRKEDLLQYCHKWIFAALIIYLIFQSIRGALFLNDPRKLLWVFFFLMLGFLAMVILYGKYPSPSVRRISLIVSAAAIAYFLLIIAYGLFSEVFRGLSRWYLQTVELGSSAQFMFPVAFAMPAFFNLIKDKYVLYRRIGWLTLIVSLIAAAYWDSRTAMIVIVGFIIISTLKIGFKKIALLLFLGSVVLVLIISFSETYLNFNSFVDNIKSTTFGSAIFKNYSDDPESARDVDRAIYIQIAFSTIRQGWQQFLFGYGLRSHSTVIAPKVKELFAEYLPERALAIEDWDKVGTESFTAFIVDTGVIGFLLLVANFFLVGWIIIRTKNNPHKIFLLFSLGVSFLWLFVINLQDNTLFYFAIMPNGILLQLNKFRKEQLPLAVKHDE